jgi:hypothetical protein
MQKKYFKLSVGLAHLGLWAIANTMLSTPVVAQAGYSCVCGFVNQPSQCITGPATPGCSAVKGTNSCRAECRIVAQRKGFAPLSWSCVEYDQNSSIPGC